MSEEFELGDVPSGDELSPQPGLKAAPRQEVEEKGPDPAEEEDPDEVYDDSVPKAKWGRRPYVARQASRYQDSVSVSPVPKFRMFRVPENTVDLNSFMEESAGASGNPIRQITHVREDFNQDGTYSILVRYQEIFYKQP